MKVKVLISFAVAFALTGCASTSGSDVVGFLNDLTAPKIQSIGAGHYEIKDSRQNTNPEIMLKEFKEQAKEFCSKNSQSMEVEATSDFGSDGYMSKVRLEFTCSGGERMSKYGMRF